MIVREAFAFYRIFLGHDHRKIIREMAVPRRVPVMVGEWVFDDSQTQAPQLREEPRWIADAGHGMHGFALERAYRSIGLRCIHPTYSGFHQRHAEFVSLRYAVGDAQGNIAQAADGLTQ